MPACSLPYNNTMHTNKTIIILTLLTILLSSVSSCLMDYTGSVTIRAYNKSDTDLWFSHSIPKLSGPSTYEFIEGNGYYPDRVIYNDMEFFLIKNHSSGIILDEPTHNGWSWITRNVYPNGIRIQVWDNDFIQAIGWEDFIQNYNSKYKPLTEYTISTKDIKDIKSDCYYITYPQPR